MLLYCTVACLFINYKGCTKNNLNYKLFWFQSHRSCCPWKRVTWVDSMQVDISANSVVLTRRDVIAMTPLLDHQPAIPCAADHTSHKASANNPSSNNYHPYYAAHNTSSRATAARRCASCSARIHYAWQCACAVPVTCSSSIRRRFEGTALFAGSRGELRGRCG